MFADDEGMQYASGISLVNLLSKTDLSHLTHAAPLSQLSTY